MSGYETYIMGTNAIYFDKEVLKTLKDSMFWWRLSYRYQSIWRVLHIDGLEGYLWNRAGLPQYQGVRYQFFQYATLGKN
jgi:hypothetical protein